MNDIMQIARSLKESGLLINGVSKTIKNGLIEQKDFLECYWLHEVLVW